VKVILDIVGEHINDNCQHFHVNLDSYIVNKSSRLRETSAKRGDGVASRSWKKQESRGSAKGAKGAKAAAMST
jgi:hypothetical protein